MADNRLFQVVEVTDLMRGGKSYAIFRRGTAGSEAPVVRNLPTYAEALRRVNELDEHTKAQAVR